jgi:hypothetical protein
MAIADIERVAARARALHEAAGSITGHGSEAGGKGARDMLTDVLSVFGSDVGLQRLISPPGSPRGCRPAGPGRVAGRCRCGAVRMAVAQLKGQRGPRHAPAHADAGTSSSSP